MKNLGFIGAGRMATALARGCAAANLVAAEGVLASDPHEESRTKFAEQLPGARAASENAAVLRECDTIVLAVKPQMMDAALPAYRHRVGPSTLALSIAAGKALFYRQLETGIAAAYEDAGQTMACNMMTPEALEGVQAFIDKRPASWRA